MVSQSFLICARLHLLEQYHCSLHRCDSNKPTFVNNKLHIGHQPLSMDENELNMKQRLSAWEGPLLNNLSLLNRPAKSLCHPPPVNNKLNSQAFLCNTAHYPSRYFRLIYLLCAIAKLYLLCVLP